jgi:hypothetical protein
MLSRECGTIVGAVWRGVKRKRRRREIRASTIRIVAAAAERNF